MREIQEKFSCNMGIPDIEFRCNVTATEVLRAIRGVRSSPKPFAELSPRRVEDALYLLTERNMGVNKVGEVIGFDPNDDDFRNWLQAVKVKKLPALSADQSYLVQLASIPFKSLTPSEKQFLDSSLIPEGKRDESGVIHVLNPNGFKVALWRALLSDKTAEELGTVFFPTLEESQRSQAVRTCLSAAASVKGGKKNTVESRKKAAHTAVTSKNPEVAPTNVTRFMEWVVGEKCLLRKIFPSGVTRDNNKQLVVHTRRGKFPIWLAVDKLPNSHLNNLGQEFFPTAGNKQHREILMAVMNAIRDEQGPKRKGVTKITQQVDTACEILQSQEHRHAIHAAIEWILTGKEPAR